MIVALGALVVPDPVRSQSGPDCAVAGAPGPVRSGPSSATAPSNGNASVRCSYGGSRGATVSIDYRCDGNARTFQRQAARDHDERGSDGGRFVADRREGSFNSYGTRFSNQDRVFYLIDDRTYATVVAHSNGGHDLRALRALARRVASRNDPGSALGCGGSPNPEPTRTETQRTETQPTPTVAQPTETVTETPEPAPEEGSEPEPAAEGETCDRYHEEDRGLLAIFEDTLGGGVGRVGASAGVDWNIPNAPCFNEQIELSFGASAHGLDGDHCSVGASASGSLSVCTEAFCFKDCVTGTISGGWSMDSERLCEEPPYWTCDESNWCEKHSATLSLERSLAIAPTVAIGLSKVRMKCGLELGVSVGVSGNVTRFDGTSCECGGGSWAGTVRVFTTVSGSADCGVKLFGYEVGVPPFGIDGCFNAGVRRDSGSCADEGMRVVGGAAFKAQIPPFSVGWFKVNGTVQTISIPEGRETGCSGPTDL